MGAAFVLVLGGGCGGAGSPDPSDPSGSASVVQPDPAHIVSAVVGVHHSPGLNLPATEFPQDVTDPAVAEHLSSLVETLRLSTGPAVDALPPVTLSVYLDDGREYHVLSFGGEYPLQLKSFVDGEMVALDVVQSAEMSAYLDDFLVYRKG